MATYKEKYIELKNDYDSLQYKFGKLIQEIIKLNKKLDELQWGLKMERQDVSEVLTIANKIGTELNISHKEAMSAAWKIYKGE